MADQDQELKPEPGNGDQPPAENQRPEPVTPGQYGCKYKDHFLQQYLHFSQTTHDLLSVDTASNRLFIAVLTSIFVALGWLLQAQSELAASIIRGMIIIGSIFGLMVSLVWYFYSNYIYRLRGSKFQVLHDMELELPFHCTWREWEYLTGKRIINHKKDTPRKQRWYQSRKQHLLPLILAIPFIVMLIYFGWVYDPPPPMKDSPAAPPAAGMSVPAGPQGKAGPAQKAPTGVQGGGQAKGNQ